MEETRRRIAQATFELHTLIGPARTTIAAIADRAGVERATVYRHFPDERALFRGCVGHGMSTHPFPDVDPWTAIGDPEERLRVALTTLYTYYRRTEHVWPNILRDLPTMPVFQQVNAEAGVFAFFERVRSILAEGWQVTGRDRQLIRGSISHATDFPTWHSLVRQNGLTDKQAVRAMTAMVRSLAS